MKKDIIQPPIHEPETLSDEGTLLETAQEAAAEPVRPHLLEKYSLRDKAEEIDRQAAAATPLLGEIALRGQATVIYARPNSGKTLITLHLLIEAIKQGRVKPADVFYLDMDDSGAGLVEKLRLAQEYGFHVLAEGYEDFSVRAFIEGLVEMTKNETGRDVVVILDTLKKFTNLMDKKQASGFANLARQFVLKGGGSLIALAHTNKNLGADGKSIYGGTSDIVDDFDCAYTIDTSASEADGTVGMAVFQNLKSRGSVAQSVAYSFSRDKAISYEALISSVQCVDAQTLKGYRQALDLRDDAPVIAAVMAGLEAGITTKMRLVDDVASRANVSKRDALATIEKYTGDDPVTHRWRFSIGERGAKRFEALTPLVGEDPVGA